jgi:ribose 1,5-bisphosphate isomerase
MFSKKKRFEKILKDIESIKIQGARNIAKAGIKAYFIFPSRDTKKKILSLRPTEPMLENVLELAEKGVSKEKILAHFNEAQEKINQKVFRLIKNNSVIFTHCHSTNVVNALVYAKKKGKKFEVYNTETRPLFQGRKTARELSKAGIKVTMFVDSAVGVAFEIEMNARKVNMVLLGADAITKSGVINKIGSETIAILAKKNKIPLYVVADSWKFTDSRVPIEQRDLNEVWDRAPSHVKIKNPAFEFIPKKYLTKIITENS